STFIHCKNAILGIALFSLLILVIQIVSIYLKSEHSPLREICGVCPFDNFVIDIFPIVVSLSALLGAGVYYFMSRKVENKEMGLKSNAKVILNLLNADERKAVEKLLEGKGKALQAELTRLPGMSKVKSHRIVKRLQERGVITIERFGKTNVIKLNDEITEGLI
ncbi:MAG: hypothetical protein M1530_03200, partial [Candidatus Marsarchaeota archaeon]|nr:hypothetical protein [Candidatus Marsarchaeota archaeon]